MPIRGRDGQRVCFLHVGAPKTGSTAIQHFLVENDAALVRAGACYPRAGRCSWRPGHHDVATQLCAESIVDPTAGALASVIAEIGAVDAPRAIVSAENIVLADESVFPIVREAFAVVGYRIKVVLYVRAHAEYVESIYCEAVKHGFRRRFNRFVDDVLEHGVLTHSGLSLRFAFSTLAEGFARAFGSDNVLVLGYRDSGDPASLMRDFVSTIGLDPGSEDLVWPTRYANPRLSTADVIRHLDENAEELIERDAEAAAMPFAPLTADDRARIAERFADDVGHLVDRWGVDPLTFRRAERLETDSASRARELFFETERASKS